MDTVTVYAAIFDPLTGSSVGGFDWYPDQPAAEARFQELVLENSEPGLGSEHRVRLYAITVPKAYDRAAVTNFIEDFYVGSDSDDKPLNDTHPKFDEDTKLTLYYVGGSFAEAMEGMPFDSIESADSYVLDEGGEIYSVQVTVNWETISPANEEG